MLTIKQLIADRLEAFKKKGEKYQDVRYSILTTLVGELQRTEKDPTEVTIIAKIKKMIIDIESTLLLKSSDTLRMESQVLNKYIPQQLTEHEINQYLIMCMATNLGEFMKFMKANFAGRYDGKMVSTLARDFYS